MTPLQTQNPEFGGHPESSVHGYVHKSPVWTLAPPPKVYSSSVLRAPRGAPATAVGRFDPAQTCEKPARCASGAPDHSWALSRVPPNRHLAAYEIWINEKMYTLPIQVRFLVYTNQCPYFIRRQDGLLGASGKAPKSGQEHRWRSGLASHMSGLGQTAQQRSLEPLWVP